MNKSHVNKPNAMIQAGQKLSTVQAKMLYSILSRFKYLTQNETEEELEKEVYTIPFSEIVQNLSSVKGGRIYELVRDQASALVQQYLSVKSFHKNKEKTIFYNLVSKVEVRDGVSEIEASLNRDVIPLLVNMVKEGYTQIAFADVFKMKSAYAIRIYELLEQQRTSPAVKKKGYYDISIEDLRFLLGIEKKQYPRWDNFKARVLLASQKEIHEKTALRFSLEFTKTSRKISGIRFKEISIVDKVILPDGKEAKFEQTTMEIEEQTSLFPKSETFTASNPLLESLHANSRREFEENHSAEYIEHYYNKAKSVEKNNRLKSTFGDCLYAFLKNDKDEFYEIEKRKEADRIKQEELKKQKEEEARLKKIADEEREKKLAIQFTAIETLFNTLDDIEKDNYKKMVAEKNKMIAEVGGSMFHRAIVEQFGEEKGLWNQA